MIYDLCHASENLPAAPMPKPRGQLSHLATLELA